jgi:hypothetical protein
MARASSSSRSLTNEQPRACLFDVGHIDEVAERLDHLARRRVLPSNDRDVR